MNHILVPVADDEQAGRTFLEDWAEGHSLSDAELRVETGDVREAIGRAADDASLVIAGASERRLLSRLVKGSPVIDVVDDVECSVLLAERAHKRGILERIIGK